MSGQTIADLARAIGGQAVGDTSLVISGLNEPGRAGPTELAVAMDARYASQISQGSAQAAVLAQGQDWQSLGLRAAILIGRPRVAMAGLTHAFAQPQRLQQTGVHATAVIDSTAKVGTGCWIGANVVIEAGAQIGDGCRIGANSWFGSGVRVGDRAVIAPGSSICSGVSIGTDFFGHPGIVLGGDGFSFVTPEKSAVETVRETLSDATAAPEQSWIKIHSLGGVQIGDHVEIGANSSVDAGTIRATRIGDGTKIDALVQVGHNAQVGANCLLCAHVAVGGSAIIGANSVLGGQVGVADNVSLGAGVVAGGATKILSNVPAGRAVLGYPAMKMEAHVETYKALRRLPRLLARVSGLEAALKKPEDGQ
jgi:UDP-3-O-[3-hydroxymyristoyl] glucosamine N-acyltransferase